MQRRIISSLCLAAVSVASLAGQTGDWQVLFNGKDLTGWRANNDPASFTVTDGVLRVQASGKYRAHLFYVGSRQNDVEKFKSFTLEATVRAEPGSNSGIFVHTDMATRDTAKHLANGYEVQLNSSATEKRKTGSLYAVEDLDTSPVDETKWFTIGITVKDKRIMIAVDGRQLIDYTEPADVQRPPERAGRLISVAGGAIALQAHDPKSVWYFRDIRVRRLP